jgi:uncharacterized protein YndB with AHSA1/START domain
MNAAAEKPLALEMTRHFDAPPERVFDAWLSKSWGEWAGPPGVKGEVVVMEPHVGGRYRVVMHRPDGGELIVGGTFREINRPLKLVMSWKWEHEDTDTLVTLALRPSGKGTVLTLHHEGFAATERRDSHQMGWNGTLEKLAEFLGKKTD